MPRIHVIWERIERHAVYAALSIFIFAELTGYIFPTVDHLLKERAGLILISLVLLAVFRNIDHRLLNPSKGLSTAKSFGDAINTLMKNQKLVESVELFGHSTSKYYQFVRNSGCKIRNMRILLSEQLIVDSAPYPQSPKERSSIKAHAELAIENWLRLQTEGIIEQLEIRFYSFWPTFHFMIIDGESALWGLFEPIKDGPGVKVQKTYNISHEGSKNDLIDNLRTFFDATFAISAAYEKGNVSSVQNKL